MAVVSVAKGKDPYVTTVKALKNLEEVGVTIPHVKVVKPNLIFTDLNDLSNTDPRVCEALVDFLISYGEREVICAEGTTHGRGRVDTIEAFKNNGYHQMKAKISKYVDFNKEEPTQWVRIISPGLNYEVELGLAKTAVENPAASVAKLKTHDVLGLTLTIKNMMGALCQARNSNTGETITIGPETKRFMHGWGPKTPAELPTELNIGPSKIALAKNLIRLASHAMPYLGMVDGIVAMEGNGPLFGVRRNLGIIIVSTNPVACDVVACEVAGFDAMETGYIYACGEIGLGEHRLEEIEIVGDKIEEVKQSLKPHKLFPRGRFSRQEVGRLIEEEKGMVRV